MQSRTMVVVVALVAVVGVTGASAFTTATVARDAQIDVASDDSGVIGLTAGPVSGVSQNGSGALNLDLGNEGDASGLNSEGTFTYGYTTSNGDPTSTYAFAITNNDTDQHQFTVSYALDGTPNPAGSAVQFKIYDGPNNLLATASEDSDATFSLDGTSGSNIVYVVVEIDTTGVASSEDLSGTLEVTAN